MLGKFIDEMAKALPSIQVRSTSGTDITVSITPANELTECNEKDLEGWSTFIDKQNLFKRIGKILKRKIPLFENIMRSTTGCSYGISDEISTAISNLDYFSNFFEEQFDSLEPYGRIAFVIGDTNAIISTMSYVGAILASGNIAIMMVTRRMFLMAATFVHTMYEAGLPSNVLELVPHGMKSPVTFTLRVPMNIMLKNLLADIEERSNKSNDNAVNMLVTNTADINSVVHCLVNLHGMRNQIFWPLDKIYVEEARYDSFNTSLKNAVSRLNSEEQFDDAVLILHDDNWSTKFVKYNETWTEVEDSCNNVISIIPIRKLNEVVSSQGSAISIWTNDVSEVLSLQSKLKYGTVWINTFNQFDPRVPIYSNFTTFLGRRAIFENMNLVKNTEDKSFEESYIPQHFPVSKNLEDIISKASANQLVWEQTDTMERSQKLLEIRDYLLSEYPVRYHKTLDKISEEIWNRAMDHLYRCSYKLVKKFEETIYKRDFVVLCKEEPIGVIGIVAKGLEFDVLLYCIASAMTHGNAVVVIFYGGYSVHPSELKSMFPDIVQVAIIDDLNDLGLFDRIWHTSLLERRSNSIVLNSRLNIKFANFEIYATKTKSIWIPS